MGRAVGLPEKLRFDNDDMPHSLKTIAARCRTPVVARVAARVLEPVEARVLEPVEARVAARVVAPVVTRVLARIVARVLSLVLALALVLLIVLFATACDKAPVPADIRDRVVFGFAQLGDESEWRSSSTEDIKRAAAAAGVQLMFENAQQKQVNQIKAIRSFILKKVDVIAFCPIVEDGWDNVLNEAKASGIPVILVDRYIKTNEDNLYCAFIGSDFEWEGIQAGLWMMKKFGAADNEADSKAGEAGAADNEADSKPDKAAAAGGRPVRIAEISGNENSSPTIGRHEGLLKAFGGSSKFEIVISVCGDFLRSKGRECMEQILEETPDIDILYAHNDDMALGAIEIMEEHGIKPGADIVVVSVDAQKSGLEALKEGKINCMVECSPYVGDQLMDLVLRIAAGDDIPKYTYTKEKVFTETDDFSTLPTRP